MDSHLIDHHLKVSEDVGGLRDHEVQPSYFADGETEAAGETSLRSHMQCVPKPAILPL